MNSIRTAFATLSAAALLLAGCSPAEAPPPLAGARIGGPFTLTDQNGRTVRDTDFAGKYRLVYFGYTYCPDVCPTDLQKVGQALRTLDKSDPALAAKLVPIFITVDPERDKPEVIKQFVANFHPRMIGLTGSPEAIAATAKAYGIQYSKQPPAAGGGYLVDHVAITYLMGPKGEPIAFFSRDMTPDAIVAELKRWVR
jgi:protein SCO1/2